LVNVTVLIKIYFFKQYKGILYFLAKYNKVEIYYLRWWAHAP